MKLTKSESKLISCLREHKKESRRLLHRIMSRTCGESHRFLALERAFNLVVAEKWSEAENEIVKKG